MKPENFSKEGETQLTHLHKSTFMIVGSIDHDLPSDVIQRMQNSLVLI